MYSDINEYDSCFTIQKKIQIIESHATIDEKIQKYKEETKLLNDITKFNNTNNINII